MLRQSVDLTTLFQGKLRLGNISWSISAKLMGPVRTHNPCISNRNRYRLRYMANHFGVPILFNEPWIHKFSFCSIWLLWAILYEFLIPVLMDPVHQSDAYEALPGVLVNRRKRVFIAGEQRGKGHILRGTKTIFGNTQHKKTNFRFGGIREQANLFQRNKRTGT